MTPIMHSAYPHKPVSGLLKNRKFPYSVAKAFEFPIKWLRFRLLKNGLHPQRIRRCVVSNLMVEGQLLSLENAQRLLADVRRRQLECARQGKVKQSADYALKAQRLRRAIELRMQQQQHAS